MTYDPNINLKIGTAFHVSFAVTQPNSKTFEDKCTPVSQTGVLALPNKIDNNSAPHLLNQSLKATLLNVNIH